MKTRILASLVAALALAGCADTLKDVNQGLAGLNQSLAAVTGTPVPTAQRMAVAPRAPQPTAEQQAALMRALQANFADKRLTAAVAEATPNIKAVIEKRACGAMDGAGIYSAPGKNWGDFFPSPMVATRYHNRGACMTVARIHGWQMQAMNALSFEVIYLADDSGESAKQAHEVVKQPDGAWMFTH
jgi:hypothetical protein